MNNKNIILANAPLFNGNKGCVALTYSAIFLIKGIMQKFGVDYNIYLASTWTKRVVTTQIDFSGEYIPVTLCGFPCPPKGLKNRVKWLANYKHLLENRKIFKSADMIFDIGEGDSFSDIYGLQRFETIDRIHHIARKLNKPYCLLPQTIGPFTNEQVKAKARESMEKASLVMARDGQSKDFVNNTLKLSQPVDEYIDLAFLLPFNRMKFEDGYIHVGLNVSALLWYGGYTRNNQFGLACDYPELIKRIIKVMLDRQNVILHLVAHVLSDNPNDIENDYAVCYAIYKRLDKKRVRLAPFFMTPIEAKSYISGLDFFMGARMHSTIAAFSSGVPVVPMAYSRKFNGLFEETLGYHSIVDMKNSDVESSLEIINSTIENRTNVKMKIESINAGLCEERKKMTVEAVSGFITCPKGEYKA